MDQAEHKPEGRHDEDQFRDPDEALNRIAASASAARLLASVPIDNTRGSEMNLVEDGSLLDAVLDSLQAGIIVRGSDGRLLHINRGAHEIVGLTFKVTDGHAENLPEWQMQTLEGQQFDPNELPGMRTLRTGKEYSGIKVVYLHESGRRVIVSINSRPVTLPGGEAGVLISFVDITERERTRVELVDALAKAEKAAEARAAFQAVMSHEIRTPLNGIIGMLELARRESMSSSAANMVAVAHDSATALTEMLSDILEFTRAESQRQVFKQEPVAIADFAESTRDLFAAVAAKRALSIQVDVAPTVPQIVVTDANRLRQILVNLVSNALKFTSEGWVLIAIDAEHISNEERSGDATYNLQIVVEDTGPGVDPELVDTMFDPFVQGRSTVPGTGLGLSICRSLTELLGGHIRYEKCDEHCGARFVVQIPVRAVAVGTRPEMALDRAVEHSVQSGGAPQGRFAHSRPGLIIYADPDIPVRAPDALVVDSVGQFAHRLAAAPQTPVLLAVRQEDVPRLRSVIDLTDGDRTPRRTVYVRWDGSDAPKGTIPLAASELERVISASAPMLSAERVNELVTELKDAQAVIRIVDMYFEQLESRIDSISAVAAADAQQIANAAHALKSPSRTIGATKISDVAEALEHGARSGYYSDVEATVAELRELIDPTRRQWATIRTNLVVE